MHGSAWGRPGDFVVMASLGCHASAAVRDAVEVKRAGLRVPPPHSPDFNSNRECFCEAQATPPKAAARTLDAHRTRSAHDRELPPDQTATTLECAPGIGQGERIELTGVGLSEEEGVDSSANRNGSSEPDFEVPAKLRQEGLDR